MDSLIEILNDAIFRQAIKNKKIVPIKAIREMMNE